MLFLFALAALPRLVVPAMEGHAVTDDLRASLTDALVASVRKQAHGYDVLGSNDLQSLLHVQAQKQQLGCHDNATVSCLVEVGGALGADRMVFGGLDRIGKNLFLDVKLIDVPHARVLQETSATVISEDELLGAVQRAAQELFASPSPAPSPSPSPSPASASAPAPAPADGLVADSAKVYAGPDGLTVELVWLAPRSDKQVLVRVNGGSSPFEGKVLLHALEENGGSTYLVTPYHGRRWSTVVGVKHGWSNELVWELNTPGTRDGVKITFDKEASAKVQTDALLNAYRSQKASGALDALARFDRHAEEQHAEGELNQAQRAAAKSCGRDVAFHVDWKTVSDEVLKRYAIGSYCEPPLSAIRQRCESDPAFRKITLPKLHDVVCHLGSALALDLSKGTLSFTTAIDAPNQDAWALEQLAPLR